MLSIDQCLKANRPLIFAVAESDMEVLKYLDNRYKSGKFFVYSTTTAGTIKLDRLLSSKFSGEKGKRP